MQTALNKPNTVTPVVFIRAVCTLGIACFHFCCYANSSLHQLMLFANGYFGEILVTVFFVLSGFVLFYNHPTVSDTKVFYKKRWKSIFPAFYLSYAFFYLINVFTTKSIFYLSDIAPRKIVYSLMGMDGYFLELPFSQFSPNWYLVGEWFLGALIILYLLYPLLCRLFRTKQSAYLAMVIATVLFAFQAYTKCFLVNGFRNIIGCLFSFLMGMVFVQSRKAITSTFACIVSAAVFFCTLLCKLPVPSTVSTHICGFSLFVLLFKIGDILMKNTVIHKIINYVAKISFPIFLLQHKIVQYVQSVSNPTSLAKSIVVLALSVVLILAAAQVLHASTKAVLQCWPFRKKSNERAH